MYRKTHKQRVKEKERHIENKTTRQREVERDSQKWREGERKIAREGLSACTHSLQRQLTFSLGPDSVRILGMFSGNN